MTIYSKAIIKLLSYSLTDIVVSRAEEQRIIKLVRLDPNLGATLYNLKATGYLPKLFNRVDSGNHPQLLVESVAGGLAYSAYPLALSTVTTHTRFRKLFEQCFYLQSSLKKYGLVITPKGLPQKQLSNALAALGNPKPTMPFSGSGATGVDSKSLNISLLDQALLAAGSSSTVAEYSNPIPGSLSAYLSKLTVGERKAQGRALLFRRANTVFANSYLSGVPTRADIIRAAARKYNLEPALIAAFVLAEQRDQSKKEDAKDYIGATSLKKANTSIGLGQIVVSTARKHKLFDDLLSPGMTGTLAHNEISSFLTSDEFNIFGVAKYIRIVANAASGLKPAAFPNTVSSFPALNFSTYLQNSSKWPDDNIKAMASEYTSRAWDDRVSTGWGYFVFEAYKDMLSTKAI